MGFPRGLNWRALNGTQAPGGAMDKINWWERRWFLAFLILVSTVPLLWPGIPPLGDVPGHMGRFRVQLDLATSPDLQRYFDFHWMLVGNLGTDLLVELLAPVMGLEPAVKLIVITIPPLTVAGLIWTAKEIHGRIPPTMMFAIPFVYNFTFNYGFLNYSLAFALSLLAFAFWLRLTRQRRFLVRAIAFVAISCALWVVHAFGWGILGLLAFSAEVIRHHDQRRDWARAIVRAALDVAPMSLPLLVMALGSGSTVAGETSYLFDIRAKLFAVVIALRDQWLVWDSMAVAVGLVLIGSAIFDRHLEFARKLGVSAIVLAVVFVLMPGKILGLTYGDARLAPVMIMFALLAIRMRSDNQSSALLAWLGLAFLCVRLAGTSASYAKESRETQRMLEALNQIPQGSPVLFLSKDYCNDTPTIPRFAHLGSMVIVRRNGFSNDQWQAAGAQLLRVRYPEAGYFKDDRSSFLYTDECIVKTEEKLGAPLGYDHRAETALALFPRAAFDYVWMIDPPEFDMGPRPGLQPIWRSERSVLYKIDHAQDARLQAPARLPGR